MVTPRYGLVSVEVIKTNDFQLQTAESGSVMYVGKAAPGTPTDAAEWQIKRVTESDTGVEVKWADGNENFDNIWNNVTALNYS